MAKISLIASKYIVHATINIDGVVDKSDVIGAIFGQTEGLLGEELELRELQRSRRIGRIEVNVDTKGGKTDGSIIIPSSLDKAETAIIGAALEIIQRIGPCNAKIKVSNIEDVRVSKRSFVIERAKELLKNMMDSVLPDSQDITDQVAYSVRVMEIQEYGKHRLPAGPGIDESDEIIVVEGRADVITLLKHGFKNAIAMNGSNVPHTIVELSKKKILTAFVDGDRGGDLNIKELLQVCEVDFVTKAPDGKEVEELTKKEIHKALRSKVAPEQVKAEIDSNHHRQNNNNYQNKNNHKQQNKKYNTNIQRPQNKKFENRDQRTTSKKTIVQPKPTAEEKKKFKTMLEDLVGTRGAYILDKSLNILGKVPITELLTTIKSLNSGVYAVIFDGDIEKPLVNTADKINIKFIVGMESKVKDNYNKLKILTMNDL
ncbi:MAG: DNA primase DnaG [Nanoarchaeota archaeon]